MAQAPITSSARFQQFRLVEEYWNTQSNRYRVTLSNNFSNFDSLKSTETSLWEFLVHFLLLISAISTRWRVLKLSNCLRKRQHYIISAISTRWRVLKHYQDFFGTGKIPWFQQFRLVEEYWNSVKVCVVQETGLISAISTRWRVLKHVATAAAGK